MSVPVVVCGRGGRMAGLIADGVAGAPDLDLVDRLPTRPVPDLRAAADAGAVLVDFTAAEVTRRLLDQARRTPLPMVIGTSGLGPDGPDLLAAAARGTAVLAAANFSVALLAVGRFVRSLSGRVGPGWDAGVLDVHFAGKRDRPSGTARFLADRWSAGGGAEVASFRMGDGVSEHRVLAAGPGERVEVLHRIDDRSAFLPGVLGSIRFVAAAGPGLYSLDHVLDGDECP